MISVQKAKEILSLNIPSSNNIQLPLLKTLNCYLAKDVYSSINMPPFRQSAMDGYALNLKDDLSYKLIGEIKAGDTKKNRIESW